MFWNQVSTKEKIYNLVDKLYGQKRTMSVKDGVGIVKVEIGKSESFIFGLVSQK